MKKDHAYGVIVYYVENETVFFLILKQVQGHWSFPKGHSEKNEKKLETALRELKEETGISEVELVSEDIQITDEYVIKPDSSKPVHKYVEFYIGRAEDRDVIMQEGEIFEYKWITPEDGDSILTYDSSKRILKSANDLIKNYLQKKN
jgi:8-oxo-dGTP pyrophosphatase MutT (NUDIX family)